MSLVYASTQDSQTRKVLIFRSHSPPCLWFSAADCSSKPTGTEACNYGEIAGFTSPSGATVTPIFNR